MGALLAAGGGVAVVLRAGGGEGGGLRRRKRSVSIIHSVYVAKRYSEQEEGEDEHYVHVYIA